MTPNARWPVLFRLLCFGLVAHLADLVRLGSLFATRVRAFLPQRNGFVAARSVFLAFFAKFVCLVRLNATFHVAFLALGFCLDAAALPGKRRACARRQNQ